MIRRVIEAVTILLMSTAAPTLAFESLGSYGDVSSQDGGQHCGGYSLALWRHGDRVLGLLDVHEGLCGDPPCSVIEDASLDAKTGRLRFRSSVNGGLAFVGTVTREAIVGTLGGERVRLARHDDRWAADFKPNRSLRGWCDFWSGVSRCRGVRDLCASLRTPP